MFWINVKRIFRSGFTNALRNSFVSLASVFVMTMTLMIVGSLMFLNNVVGEFVTYVKEKVDVNIYFVPDADTTAIADLADSIRALPEVARITYASPEESLAAFRAGNEDDQLILQGLDELGTNPFGATLSVVAKNPSDYQSIVQFVDDHAPTSLIDRINYKSAQVKLAIDRLERITLYVERFGYVVIALFALASILITFNTVRLAIYTAREEIGVMRLVGASNAYIRGPFIVETTLHGLLSAVIALILFFPLTFLFRGATMEAFQADLVALYVNNLWLFGLVLILAGGLLGAISSLLAVRKYLTV
jgi:cell division transport system permease protein